MSWSLRYRLLSHIRSSIWIVPLIAVFVQFILKRLSERLGVWMLHQGYYDLKTGFYGLDVAGASAMLERVFSLSVSCLVFAFGSLLVAIQVAGGQYTPRIIATTLLRDNVIRTIVGLFVVTLLWSNRTLVQIGFLEKVPQFQVFIASILALFSLIAFLVLINYAARLLRPVSLVRTVAEAGLKVIAKTYPTLHVQAAAPAATPQPVKRHRGFFSWGARAVQAPVPASAGRGTPSRVIRHQGSSGIVIAVNVPALIAIARRADCVIELVPEVGDFVAVDEPLFHLYGDVKSIDGQSVRDLVALGSERTLEQDPMFAFRIEVDIALKALSPAINDPTTAVLAIDQLHRLLRSVGQRSLRGEEIADETGRPRLVVRTPTWVDFVHITFREIRQAGGGNLQVVRRLRAMIHNLLETAPPHRHPELLLELELLDREIVRRLVDPEDIALARMPDPQGLGGAWPAWRQQAEKEPAAVTTEA